LGHLLAELPVALLRPDPDLLVEVERPERLDDRPAGGIDDGAQPARPTGTSVLPKSNVMPQCGGLE
jgi:hypothetical protein